MTLNGIDVSNHNHPIDPNAVPGDFVIMRSSEGKGMRDPHFAEYDRKVRDGPKLAGAYHFMWIGRNGMVINTAKSEAENFARAVESHLRPGFLLVADFEPAGPLSWRTDWAVEFGHEVKRLAGRTPLLYANRSTLDGGDWSAWRRELGEAYWLAGGTAQYAQRTDGYNPGTRGRNPHGFGDPILWQYTEHGYLPGWPKRLDLNVFYGGAAAWRALADGDETKELPVTTPTIPAIRESDPKVWINTPHSISKKGGWGCVCMQITLPLVDAEMRRRGLVKQGVDFFQFGYNAGGVAASAGTHDGGGIVDCAQGITREQREVWAMFGWMMAPRTREWGWTGGAHGHGVLHGCIHRSPAAARQIVTMMNGRNGLVSNTVVNWVKPSRTWQDAYLATAAPSPEVPPTEDEDLMAERRVTTTRFHHPGGWMVPPEKCVPADPDHALLITHASAHIIVPEGVELRTRWVSDSGNRAMFDNGWVRYPTIPHPMHVCQATRELEDQAWAGSDLQIDIWVSEPCEVHMRQTALWHKKTA